MAATKTNRLTSYFGSIARKDTSPKTDLGALLRARRPSTVRLVDVELLDPSDFIRNPDGSIDYFASRIQAAATQGIPLEKLVV
ncbi:MAG TPA: hypothetical protein VKV24_20045 [Casimicrobiaceae bacterium]|nr:hypothetical protein [Casimicrobiaceae bacterium]